MKLKIIKGMCLILFLGILPSAEALTISCEHIWTVKCEDCLAPMLMDCYIDEVCRRSDGGGGQEEQCFGGGNPKGHIKNNTVIDTRMK